MLLRSLIIPALRGAEAMCSLVRRVPKGSIRILILHDTPSHWDDSLRRLLDHIAAGPGFVTPVEAEARLEGLTGKDDRCPVLLTFDDGFVCNARAAHDILDPMGIKALYFVCPGLIDMPAEDRREVIARQVFRGARTSQSLGPDMEVMRWDAVAELAAAGHAIGCHGLDHTCLSGLDAAALRLQVVEAKSRLDSCLGQDTRWFAFPFGDIGSINAAALAVIGGSFRWCRSGVRGPAHAEHPALALGAESVDLGSAWEWQKACAEGALAPLYRRRMRHLVALAGALR